MSNNSHKSLSPSIPQSPNTPLCVLRVFVSVFFVVVLSLPAFSQNKHTISGHVTDKASGESLIGAYVYDKDNKSRGTSTNVYGFYSITVEEGERQIEASFIGYNTLQITFDVTNDTTINFALDPGSIVLDQEVVISADRPDENVESTDMGKVDLSVEKIKSIPALMGEVDVIRAIQLLPGVMSSGELNSGLYVRGGGPDQNLILLDEAVVYNTGHLFGFFSVFNADAISNTTLHKGSMPAEYGGRLSSVLDVNMKEGNYNKYKVNGGIGIISSRLTIQGPIQKEKSSFLIAGRRTYGDILARPFLKGTDFEGNGYYFYDLNLKANYRFSDKDRLFLSGYFGRDVFNFRSTDGFNLRMPWGNATATLRWNHVFSNKLFMNASAIYNTYDFEVDASFADLNSRFFSGVRDYNFKLDFDLFANAAHTIKFGANYTYHTFTPYSVQATVGDSELTTDDLNKENAHEAAIYIQDEITFTDRLKMNIGLRASAYQQVGPYLSPVFNEQGLPTDSIRYDRGEPIVTYGALEPRLALRYGISDKASIKAGVTFTNQYIHLVANSTSTLPTDLWVPSTQRTKPQKGIQYSLGYFQNFLDNQYEASIEVYYKDLQNQIEFSEFYVPELNEPVENSFVYGEGYSYGIELFLKKRMGNFNGWIGYTLSKTERLFPEINDGIAFPAKYDRRHDLSIVTSYKLSKRWDLAATFVYGTGQALTLPNTFFLINNWLYSDYDMPRNGYRLKPYHRLDLSATWDLNKKPNPKIDNELVFSVYNVYNRYNPFMVYALPEVPADDPTSIDVKLNQISLFPVIPSISWNFSF